MLILFGASVVDAGQTINHIGLMSHAQTRQQGVRGGGWGLVAVRLLEIICSDMLLF